MASTPLPPLAFSPSLSPLDSPPSSPLPPGLISHSGPPSPVLHIMPRRQREAREEIDTSATHTYNALSSFQESKVARSFFFQGAENVLPVEVEGDGNCFWRALCVHLTGDQAAYRRVKREVEGHFHQNQELFGNFFKGLEAFEERKEEEDEEGNIFLSHKGKRILKETEKRLQEDGSWAGPPEIQIAASFLQRPIFIFGCFTQGDQPSFGEGTKSCFHVSYEPFDDRPWGSPLAILFHPASRIPPPGGSLNPNHFTPLLLKKGHEDT